MRRLFPILLLLAGCGSKSGEPPADTEKLGWPIVPDAIASQLGGASTIVALDLHGWDTSKLGKMLPPGLDCVREVIAGTGIVAVGAGDAVTGFATGTPEAPLKKCIETLGPMMSVQAAMENGTYTITAGDTKVSLVWTNGTLHAEEVGHPLKPALPGVAMRAQIARVPANAMMWFASNGFAKQKITRALAYVENRGDKWHIVLDDEGSEPHVAKTWTADLLEGFKAGTAERHVHFDDSWFTLTEPTPMMAHLEGTIPFGVFSSVGQGVNE